MEGKIEGGVQYVTGVEREQEEHGGRDKGDTERAYRLRAAELNGGQNALCYEVTLAQFLYVFSHFLGLSTSLTLKPW